MPWPGSATDKPDQKKDEKTPISPTKPACAGSWPEPPPHMRATFDVS